MAAKERKNRFECIMERTVDSRRSGRILEPNNKDIHNDARTDEIAYNAKNFSVMQPGYTPSKD